MGPTLGGRRPGAAKAPPVAVGEPASAAGSVTDAGSGARRHRLGSLVALLRLGAPVQGRVRAVCGALRLSPLQRRRADDPGGGRRFRTAPLERPCGRGVNFQLPVQDVDAVHGRAVDAGVEIVVPKERWYLVDVVERSGRGLTRLQCRVSSGGAGGEGRKSARGVLACFSVGAVLKSPSPGGVAGPCGIGEIVGPCLEQHIVPPAASVEIE